jgi:hypothetical protein
MHGAFAMVREMLVQDPAYRPTRSRYLTRTHSSSLLRVNVPRDAKVREWHRGKDRERGFRITTLCTFASGVYVELCGAIVPPVSIPPSRELRSLVLSETANKLAHDALGTRGRRLVTGLVVGAAVLGYAVGFTGLGGLIGKPAVEVLGLVAGIVSTVAFWALTSMKPGEHLRFAGEYEQLLMATMPLAGEEDTAKYERCQEDFKKLVRRTRDAGIALTNGQITKYERMARTQLKDEYGVDSADAELLNAA